MSAGRFPQRIKRGSCVVTIYKTPTKGYNAFTVVHTPVVRAVPPDVQQSRAGAPGGQGYGC